MDAGNELIFEMEIKIRELERESSLRMIQMQPSFSNKHLIEAPVPIFISIRYT